METTFDTIRSILGNPIWGFAWKLLLFSVGLLWVSLVLWTLKDARKRIDDWLIVLVAVATSLVFPFIGSLVYTILRPSEYLADVEERGLEMQAMELELRQMRSCPGCHEPIHDDYLVCPNCRKNLRLVCPSCGRALEYSWKACPYCALDVEMRQSSTQAGRVSAPTATGSAPVGSGARSQAVVEQATQLLEG